MTGLPPPTRSEVFDQIEATIRVVAEAGRLMDEKWGIGRLPRLVPIEWANKFAVQKLKWQTVGLDDLDGTVKQGGAMLRAYAKLDELAVAEGHQPLPPDQWEMEIDGRLVILVRDIRQGGLVVDGRRHEVWSLDEIANVIRAHPSIAAVKQEIAGAVVEPLGKSASAKLDDTLDGLPW